jgi:hypothetical protein
MIQPGPDVTAADGYLRWLGARPEPLLFRLSTLGVEEVGALRNCGAGMDDGGCVAGWVETARSGPGPWGLLQRDTGTRGRRTVGTAPEPVNKQTYSPPFNDADST